MTEPAVARTRLLALGALAWLAPSLLGRVAALVLLQRPLAAVDAYGLASDLGVGLALLALFSGAGTASRYAARLVALVLALFAYANLEHVLVHDASIDFYYLSNATDPTFVSGSMLLPKQPLLLVLFVASAAGLWLAPAGVSLGARTRLAFGVVAALLVAVSEINYPDLQQASWRQRHVLHRGLFELPELWREQRSFTRLSEVRMGFAAPAQPPAGMEPWHALLHDTDLSGAPRFEPGLGLGSGRRPNVVVLLLESLSGAHFPSLAPPHARSELYSLPKSDALLARSGFSFAEFVALQRTTNRGEYALLCGDHPNLVLHVAKMDMAAYDGLHLRQCLPWRMQELGYRTVYLQSAPMKYMHKDPFMRYAGFQELRGFDTFDPSSIVSGWGPDDRTLLRAAADLIEGQRGKDRPLFMTVLSVGTHHPYAVAPGFQGKHPAGTLEAAIEFLDLALHEFVTRLEQSGAFEDTYLMVSADESIGYERGTPTQQHYAQNWIPLFLRGPGVPIGTTSERFSQGDLALSVLDLIGARQGPLPPGRSFLRSYAKPRLLAFGNTRYRDVTVRFTDGTLLTCDAKVEHCEALRPEGERLVAPSYAPASPVPEDEQRLRQFLSWNERGYPDRMANPQMRLTPASRLHVAAGAAQTLVGGQAIAVANGTQLQVQIELRPVAADVRVEARLHSGAAVLYRWQPLTLPRGKTGQLWLDYHSAAGLRDAAVEVRFATDAASGTDVEVPVAELRQRPAGNVPHGVLTGWSRVLVR